MANGINPLLAFEAQTPDIQRTFQNALANIQGIDQLVTARQQAPVRQGILEQQLAGLQAERRQDPIRQTILEAQAAREQAAVPTQEQLFNEAQLSQLTSLATLAQQTLPQVQAGNVEGARSQINRAIAERQQQNLNTADFEEALALLNQDPVAFARDAQETIGAGQRLGVIQQPDISRVGVQSSQILGDGTTIQVLRNGQVRVTDPEGREVTGRQRAEAIQNAREQEALQQGERAGARTTATLESRLGLEPTVEAATAAAEQAIQESGEAFDRLEPIRQNIANFDEVIRLIDEGAQTGVIASRLPSFSRTAIELDNLQSRLGLDVIGNTTFGALSESELAFALRSALPTNLSPQALREWTIRKRDSQQKLANYIQEAAIFLGTPGNTIADFLELQQLRTLQEEEGARNNLGVQPTTGAARLPQVPPTPTQAPSAVGAVQTEDAQLPQPFVTGQPQNIGRFQVVEIQTPGQQQPQQPALRRTGPRRTATQITEPGGSR